MATGNILIADDDTAIRTVLSQALSRAGYDVRATGTAATLWRSMPPEARFGFVIVRWAGRPRVSVRVPSSTMIAYS